MKPEISVICPVYNEMEFLRELVSHLLSMPPLNKEIIFIDGGSNDGTRELLVKIEEHHDEIRVLDNDKKIVPYALNLAIPECRADLVIRIDAHTDYAPDYFQTILSTFDTVDADIVGGPTRTRSKGDMQAAVAHAICTRFAVGGSKVHQLDYKGYTDSVTFGAWKKSMFDTTGLFDTSLIRNQDDEFHYRAKSMGFKIYQNPDIKLWYYPRNTLQGLFSQYFQYGYYKPDVLRKISSEVKLRHLAPALFIIYLVGLPLALLWWPYILPGQIYLITLFFFVATSPLSWKQRLNLLFVYPTIHIAYGMGFIQGFIKSTFT